MDTLFSHVNVVTMNEQMTLWQDAFVGVTFEDFNFAKGFFELNFITGFNVLSNELEGISIGNGGIVVVFVDVVAKSIFRTSVVSNQRGTRQTNHNSVSI